MNGIADNVWVRRASVVCAGAGMALAGCGGGSPGAMQAATPLFFVVTGAGRPTLAEITDATPGAQIYFTTDGSTPTAGSTVYSGPVTVLSTETIEAIAAATGYSDSAVGSATYVILQASAPVFSVAPGIYGSTQTVGISSSTAGALIYYTTDGSTPTTSSTLYLGPVTVAASETIKAIAVVGGFTNSTVATADYTIKLPQPGAVLTGLVLDGQQPIVGAHVYLFAANSTGYGQASVALLNAAQTGASDALGAYVATGGTGGFSLTGDFTCTSGQQQIYVLALGGNAGQGANPAAGLMAAIGSCPSGGGSPVFATVNEVTTVAAAYALAGFAVDATHVSSSGTALAQLGLTNAFANAGNLVTPATGAALAVTPAGNGTVPQAEIDTLANALAACVGSAGSASAACGSLLGGALSGGTSGTAPADTATAAINIAHHPGTNVGGLYALAAGTQAFGQGLSAQPASFAIGIDYASVASSPRSVAIDGSGNVWIANAGGNNVLKLSSLGVVLSGAGGYTSTGFSVPFGIALDDAGNAWVTNAGNDVVKFSSSGGVIYRGIRGGVLDGTTGIAVDGTGSVWIANFGINSVTEVSGSDNFVATFTGGGISQPQAIAIDGAGNAWVANGNGGSVSKISTAGPSQLSGGGLGSSTGIASDSSGDAWVASAAGNGVAELANAGNFLSGTAGYPGSGSGGMSIAVDGAGNVWSGSVFGLTELSNAGAVQLQIPGLGRSGIAVDGSGSVWLAGPGVMQMIGAATPVITPIAAGLPSAPTANGSSSLATRP